MFILPYWKILKILRAVGENRTHYKDGWFYLPYVFILKTKFSYLTTWNIVYVP